MRFILALFMLVLSTAAFGSEKPRLTDFKKNVYSQWGEDGIIQKIFEIIGTTSKIAIEFGAYDGITLSNTANLWINQPGWTAILIESNSQFYSQAIANAARYPCMFINEAVGIGEDSLESLLRKACNNQCRYYVHSHSFKKFSFDFSAPVDILSIDIDGNDYYVFQSLEKLRPRVVICEYNPSIPANFDVYTDYSYGNHLGCSVAALQRVAAEKGYSLVSLTDTNAVFVVNEEFSKFADFETDLEHLRIDRWIAFIISDYDGNYKVLGTKNFANPWTWTGNSSSVNFFGNISVVPRKVSE